MQIIKHVQYIGIDQSYSNTGITFLHSDGEVETVSLKSEKGSRADLQGMIDMVLMISKEITRNGWMPEKDFFSVQVGIEGAAISTAGGTTMGQRLPELAGAIKYMLRSQLDLEVSEVNIASWKSRIALNKLRGKKKQTIAQVAEYLQIVQEITSIEFSDPDAADSYMIALYTKKRAEGEIPWNLSKTKPKKKSKTAKNQ